MTRNEGRFIGVVPDVNVRADGRCYFLLDPARQFTGVAGCGPARRVDSPGGGVWDTLEVQTRLAIPSARPMQYRLDGATPPEGAAGLAISRLPVAPDASVATVEDLSGVTTSDKTHRAVSDIA